MKHLLGILLALIISFPIVSYAELEPPLPERFTTMTLAGASTFSLGIGLLTTALLTTQWEPIEASAEILGTTFIGVLEPDNPAGLWVVYGIAGAAILAGIIIIVIDSIYRALRRCRRSSND